MKKRIYLSPPHLSGAELSYMEDAIQSNWVATIGPHVDAFEQELASFTGAEYVVSVNSGTAALHLGLLVLGVTTGDEVLCSSLTFCASVNPISYCGATPVLIDSESQTWNMDPDLLDEGIRDRIKKGRRPKAIIVVHLYGMPARIREIMEVARKYEIPVIEDAAEALGATYHGRKCGTLGDIGIYSFNGNKIITTSGGGALVSCHKEWMDQARFLATQARDAAPHYQHSQIGYNYRLSNISAGIGRAQLTVIDDRIRQRRNNFAYYSRALGKLPGVSFQPEITGAFANRWLTCISIDPALSRGVTREKVRIRLEQENIESRPLWKPMHLQPLYQHAPYYGRGVSEALFENGLCLPSGSNLDEETLARITGIIKSEWT